MPIAISDRFENAADSPFSPARDAFPVIPDDTQPLTILPKALLVLASGTVVLRGIDAAQDVTIPVNAGQIIPIRAAYVRATGTNANVIGLA